ncbi:MAG: hypothetical protein JSR12_11495 [Bacteroidetes bacterium]|nr:hypothetical protein [Bacteroidota bacterium]
MELKDWASVAQILTAISLIYGAVQITINRKQLFSNTISRCLNEFQKINISVDCIDTLTIKKYIDLVGEELFYFQNHYIPKNVAKEWLDGMLDFLPITDSKEVVLNKDHCIIYLGENRSQLLKNYPRIKSAFTLSNEYDIELMYDDSLKSADLRLQIRKNIVEEIYENVRRFEF